MRAVAFTLAAAQAVFATVLALRHAEVSMPLIHDTIAFEAWERSPVLPQHVLMAADSDDAAKCSNGPIKVRVRISACFTASEVTAIDTWVKNSLATAPPTFYSNDNAIDNFDFTASKTTPSSGCTDGSVLSDTNFRNALSFMTASSSSDSGGEFDGVLTFVKNSNNLGALGSQSKAYQLQFRVCTSATCTAASDDAVLSSVEAISGYSASAIERNFYCSRKIPGAVPVSYKDNNGKRSCVCTCPSGTEYKATGSDKGCVATGEGQLRTCDWNDAPAGYTCQWSSSTATSMSLGTDCPVAIPIPTDNYVNDARINKHDQDSVLGADPIVKVSATLQTNAAVAPSIKQTWQAYEANPENELKKITLNTFGVYNLSITASDYRATARCDGCLALVDNFLPRSSKTCPSGCSSSASNPETLTSSTLNTAILNENNFYNFFAEANVLNNANSDERCDDKSFKQRDFYETTLTDKTTSSTRCFKNTLMQELLNKPLSTVNPITDTSVTNLDSLKCMRCCDEHVFLKEYTTNFKCSGSDLRTCSGPGTGASCSFSHCVKVSATSIITTSASISAASVSKSNTVLDGLPSRPSNANPSANVYRSIPCSMYDASSARCTFSDKLLNLATPSAGWAGSFPLATDQTLNSVVGGLDAASYVFWRYSIDGLAWNVWNDQTVVSFNKYQSTVKLEAWTRCGKLGEYSFNVYVFKHSPHNVCAAFPTMWYQAASNPIKKSSAICAYAGSDFAAITFDYQGELGLVHDVNTVKGKITDVKCTIKLAEVPEGTSEEVSASDSNTLFSSVVSAPFPVSYSTSGTIKVLKNFAAELVHLPNTAARTAAQLHCDFTFHNFGATDTSTDEYEHCDHVLALTDCDAPLIEKKSKMEVCAAGKCLAAAQSSNPGPFETCGGSVFTNVGQTTTEKQASSTCCADCGNGITLQCTPILGLPTEFASQEIKRCEPSSTTGTATGRGLRHYHGFYQGLLASDETVLLTDDDTTDGTAGETNGDTGGDTTAGTTTADTTTTDTTTTDTTTADTTTTDTTTADTTTTSDTTTTDTTTTDTTTADTTADATADTTADATADTTDDTTADTTDDTTDDTADLTEAEAQEKETPEEREQRRLPNLFTNPEITASALVVLVALVAVQRRAAAVARARAEEDAYYPLLE